MNKFQFNFTNIKAMFSRYKSRSTCKINLVDIMLDHRTMFYREVDDRKLLMAIKDLIKQGCNVNALGNNNRAPLYEAATYSLNEVAHELLKAGADLNAHNKLTSSTPLHEAVLLKNTELVCMLLCYGADVTVTNKRNLTPLMLAMSISAVEIVEVLFDYYADFSYVNAGGDSALWLAVGAHNPIAIRLVKAGADVNFHTAHDNILSLALTYPTAELFKLVWPKFDHRILLNNSLQFMIRFLIWCRFPTPQWLECLYLILESDEAFHLIWNCSEWKDGKSKFNILTYLIIVFEERKIQRNDRINLIYICLSLRFFSLPHGLKKDLLSYMWQKLRSTCINDSDKQRVHSIIEGANEVPSLVELSRNQTRKWIKKTCAVKKPYQFYDVVKKLQLPPSIKDEICFKKPIYL